MILAHQSDWTGMVLVLIPLAFFAWLLHVANRRASRAGVPPRPDLSSSVEPGDVGPDRP